MVRTLIVFGAILVVMMMECEAGRLGQFSFLGKKDKELEAEPVLPVPFGVDPVKWKGFLEFQEFQQADDKRDDYAREARLTQIASNAQDRPMQPAPASPFNNRAQASDRGAAQLYPIQKQQPDHENDDANGHANHDDQPDAQPVLSHHVDQEGEFGLIEFLNRQLSPFAVAAINRGMPKMNQGLVLPALPWSSASDPVPIDRQPLDEAKLRITLKELYIWSDPLTAEQALDKLESIEPHYSEIKAKLPIDSHKLISFSQEIELHCPDEPYLVDMIKTKELIVKKHASLTNYINECISSFLEICDSKKSLENRCYRFLKKYEQGWRMLEAIYSIMERHRREKVFNEDSIGVVSLQDYVGTSEEKGSILRQLKATCNKLLEFMSVLRLDTYLESRKDDRDFDWFLKGHSVCKKLVDENFSEKMKYI